MVRKGNLFEKMLPNNIEAHNGLGFPCCTTFDSTQQLREQSDRGGVIITEHTHTLSLSLSLDGSQLRTQHDARA